ncbi:MAG: methionyl-tRNA formyltransferase [Chlamydiota bacterium]
MSKLRVVFFGTSIFAAQLLRFLVDHDVNIIAVVTRPDKPRGRSLQLLPPPVKEIAQKICLHIPLYQPKKASTDEFVEILKQFQADLFVVVAYGEIIKENVLSLPRLGCINVHASLLPEYRGAAPMQRALMDGVKKTGITIIDMVLEMDAGDIIATAEMSVPKEMILGELQEKLCFLACPLLLDVIKDFENGNVQKIPQDSSKITFAPKIQPKEEEIDWALSAEVIHNQIRALSPQPGAWCYVQVGQEVKRLKIKKSMPLDCEGEFKKNISFNKREWIVACGKGALSLLEVQLEGKKSLSIKDFLSGYSSIHIF